MYVNVSSKADNDNPCVIAASFPVAPICDRVRPPEGGAIAATLQIVSDSLAMLYFVVLYLYFIQL